MKSQLPFDLQKLVPKESIKFGSVTIPKYGSLTPLEQDALAAVDDSLSMALYKPAIVKAFLICRCDIPEDTDLTKVPKHLIEPVYDFVINEINEWKPKSNEEGEKKELTGSDSTTSLDSTTLTQNSGTVQPTSSELP